MALRVCSERPQPARTMSAEERLLLLLARGRLTDSIRDQARSLIEQKPSWPQILRQASVYGVTPFLYRHLRQFGFPNVPATVVEELSAIYRMNALRNARMVRELVEVLQHLGAAKIPVMPLKGVALAVSLHGDPALRVCGDIDILVPPPMVGQAYQCLRSMGYHGVPEVRAEEPFPAHRLKTSIECQLIREKHNLRYLLELHWAVFLRAPSERSAVEALWADARATPVFGVMAFRPSAEWTLICLAVHAARHQWQGLKWLSDIHELCTWTEINWAKVRLQASRVGWHHALELTLNACHHLFGTSIPPHFSHRTLPPGVRLYPDDIFPTEPWQTLWDRARLFTSPTGRWHYRLHTILVPTSNDHQLVRLPAALSPLYFPLRILRLTNKYGVRLAANLLRLSSRTRSSR